MVLRLYIYRSWGAMREGERRLNCSLKFVFCKNHNTGIKPLWSGNRENIVLQTLINHKTRSFSLLNELCHLGIYIHVLTKLSSVRTTNILIHHLVAFHIGKCNYDCNYFEVSKARHIYIYILLFNCLNTRLCIVYWQKCCLVH